MNYLKLALPALIIGILFGGIFFVATRVQAPAPPAATQVETSASFTYEIVSTDATREQGLSGRTSIPENYGMLFVFPQKDLHGFWMKDMQFAIDMIWIRDDGTIIGIEQEATPESFPQSFFPPEPVRYVLETVPGEAERQGWTIGTQIELPLAQQ
ncbi:DUF192 domain-containing protein [Patescibacteria group bacterium]|nr:DUF192 domain-containing protein [Patescibacteria group bacterium]MBU1500751.1 DUF192 domain-containing protein [Patescibacteria group bacterium]MBU2080806.1 DUF192 domain-containing protein [Patescibacteria group bacterium]MBU2123911.1 DUF192 domain-containing protein [Patescibacteria group bacterium]MBU2194798.1 DUF192 domain-containing protein [Patescibacteria group bacterium]